MTPRPQEFVQRSNARGALALLADWGAIFCTIGISIWADHWAVYVASVWLIGSFQYAIGESLLHEASHYNLFRTRRLNDALEFLYGYPFFVDMRQYRYWHTNHHYKMGTDMDHLVEDYRIHGLNGPSRNVFWLWFVKPLTGYAGYFYLRFTIELHPVRSALKFAAFWIPLAGLFLYLDALHLLVLYWLVPFLWSFASFFYWAEISEHYNARSGSRSDLGRLKNLFHHNGGYHYIHHAYPSIPWYNLPRAHKSLCPDGTDIAHGFLDVYRQLKS